MKKLSKNTNVKAKKPLTAKKKEQIMTVFGTAFIILLTITSAFAVDARNKNLVSIMNTATFETLNG
tara:strand:- start:91982 stop:92179 length:198 start_codon:yes stop_codon:yes gene_type:complete